MIEVRILWCYAMQCHKINCFDQNARKPQVVCESKLIRKTNHMIISSKMHLYVPEAEQPWPSGNALN